MSNLDDGFNVIYSYSWDDAIADGTFVRVPDEVSKQLYRYPIAVTRTIWERFVKGKDINGVLWDILWMMKHGKVQGSHCYFKVKLGRELVDLEAVCEARSPDNPEPILTIYLPEER